jgi:hypothetical protein
MDLVLISQYPIIPIKSQILIMSKIRPLSAYQLNKSESQKLIKCKGPRPLTAIIESLYKSPSEMLKDIDLNSDIDPTTVLPKESSGSKLYTAMPRPQTASVKAKPTLKINTISLSKALQPSQIDNKQERIDLIHKLRTICNTRSSKLLEDTSQDKKQSKAQYQSDEFVYEIKKIWDGMKLGKINPGAYKKSFSSQKFEGVKDAKINEGVNKNKAFEVEKFNSNLNYISIPGLSRPDSDAELPVILESKNSNNEKNEKISHIRLRSKDMNLKQIIIKSSDLKYYRKLCDIKEFSLDLKEKNITKGFKGRTLKKKKTLPINFNTQGVRTE